MLRDAVPDNPTAIKSLLLFEVGTPNVSGHNTCEPNKRLVSFILFIIKQ